MAANTNKFLVRDLRDMVQVENFNTNLLATRISNLNKRVKVLEKKSKSPVVGIYVILSSICIAALINDTVELQARVKKLEKALEERMEDTACDD